MLFLVGRALCRLYWDLSHNVYHKASSRHARYANLYQTIIHFEEKKKSKLRSNGMYLDM
jgi:hypothetical protein